MASIFKCRNCGEKYDHDEMASETDIAICKWCEGEIT
jgi:DNA-directed RNA polymerase subunit RPC12/RpoP